MTKRRSGVSVTTRTSRARFPTMAGSRTYRTKALVLDKTKLKETDLILTLVDERGRQIRAVAKGARKPGGRLAARCELFCTVDLLIARGRSSWMPRSGPPRPTSGRVPRVHSPRSPAAARMRIPRIRSSSRSPRVPYVWWVRVPTRPISTCSSPRSPLSSWPMSATVPIFRPACHAGIRCSRISHPKREVFSADRALRAFPGPNSSRPARSLG